MHIMTTIQVIAACLAFNCSVPAQQWDAAPKPPANTKAMAPEGLTPTQWMSIRSAYEAGRHRVVQVGGDYQARNPGQSWMTKFRNGAFEITPNTANWTWGLRLKGYGYDGKERLISDPCQTNTEKARLTYHWGSDLEEWYINDQRGLEHGYTLHQAPSDSGRRAGDLLRFRLAVLGNLTMAIEATGRGVRFLDASGTTALTYSGLCVLDADGKDLAAGFTQEDEYLVLSVNDQGARYPLTVDPIVQQAYLKASNTDADDRFGYSVAVSGDTVVVSAPLEDSKATGIDGDQTDNTAPNAGAVYVFVRTNYRYVQEAYLKASNTDAGDFFGVSVAVDGDTLVVGAMFEDSNGAGVNANQGNHGAGLQSGAVYVFARNNNQWTQEVYIKASNPRADFRFGQAIAVSGNKIVVGSPRESTLDHHSGAAYVFARNSQSVWTQEALLKASNGGRFDWFGWSVGISGNTLVVGTPYEASKSRVINSNAYDNTAGLAGAAYAYTWNGSTWREEAYLKPFNTDAGDQFGTSVSVSGDTVVVGAPSESSAATGINGNGFNNTGVRSGAVYAFIRKNSIWTQEAYIKASNTGISDWFGFSVSIDRDNLAVGATREDSSATGINGAGNNNAATDAGAAYVFGRVAGTWVQKGYLKASNTDAGDSFGFSIGMSGTTIVVGAPLEDSNATGVNGNSLDNSIAAAGATYAFGDPCQVFATASRIGTGCVGSGTAPTLDSTPPRQGQTCTWSVISGLINTPGVVLVGIPHLPTALGFGCTAYFDLSLLTIPVFFITDASGGWTSPAIPVSSAPHIMCSEVAIQAAFDDSNTAPLGLALSNGVWVRLGN
jgi:hypothetical protein